jgi:hypothetical protein
VDEEKELNVVFSMDCLPAGGKREVHGPGRWDDAEAAPLAFARVLGELEFKATFFIAPSALERLAGPVGELACGGCELGLLCHPQLSGYQACLGSYSYEVQREIVGFSRAQWEDRLGTSPSCFRSGFFSANDYTYHVLCMEGFRQGSCSLPGRLDHDQCSVWLRGYPFPHHTDPLDRAAAGTMEFFEVPVTSDFEAAAYMSYETYTPPHLRIEEPDVHEDARDLAQRHLARMGEDGIVVKVLHFVTSNLIGWHQADDPHAERLQNLCTMVREVARQAGLRLRWRSLEALHRLRDELLGVGMALPDDEAP